jgi:hypothetical protein
MKLALVLLLALPVGCERRSSTAVSDAVRPVSSLDASNVSVPATASARHVVERWNRAHNAHDFQDLASLYAPTVLFYGTELTKAACVEKKRRAFAATPGYVQSIRDATFEAGKNDRTFVRLVKTSTPQGKSSTYPAILVIDASGAIVEENDDLPEDWCFDRNKQGLSLQAEGNERVVAPFRMSASEAMSKTRFSKHVQGLPELVGDMRNLTCARRCAVQTRECGFSVSLHDMKQHDQETPSSLMETVNIEPVTRTLWWEEHSPNGGSVWVSEQL